MEKSNEIIRVYGRVQGVGFRYSAQQTAWAMGICGFVTNETDGSVYIEAEGSSEQIRLFIDWCRKGPSRSIVQDIRHFPGTLMNYTSFKVK
ncbi:MAG: acylphosphatase [Lentimicrobium sp.]